MKRFALSALVFVCLSTTIHAQTGSCRNVGGGGSLAADSISATTAAPIYAPRQWGSTGTYLGNNGVVSYLGFTMGAFGGWFYNPNARQLLAFIPRSRAEGVFLNSNAQPVDCTPNVLAPGQLLAACPHQLVLPDACGEYLGEYRTRHWAAPGWYAPLNYGGINGNSISPGVDAAWATPYNPTSDFAGGIFANGHFANQQYDNHLNILSVYPFATPPRPGGTILVNSLRHGLTLCQIGQMITKVEAAYTSGGFRGDPNYMSYDPTWFKGGLQSYFELINCGYQMFLDDVGSPGYTIGPCPQVLGHIMFIDAPSNVVFLESDNAALFPSVQATVGGTGWIETGNSTCQNDSFHSLPPIGENWVPNSTMPQQLMLRYQLYDTFFSSRCVYPNGTHCGSKEWRDVITDFDPNIMSVGAKDTADANGNNGDVYWSIRYFTVNGINTTDLYNRILKSAYMPNSGLSATNSSVYAAMLNWGLAIPPVIDPFAVPPQFDDYIPSAIGGVFLETIGTTRGKHTANNLEAQQGNYAIIGGMMFNAQPNPPGTAPAPAIADPTPVDTGYPVSTTGSSPIAPGGDAPNGAPIP